jgi:hypothetical protein
MFFGSHRPFVNRGSVSSGNHRNPQGPARVSAYADSTRRASLFLGGAACWAIKRPLIAQVCRLGGQLSDLLSR